MADVQAEIAKFFQVMDRKLPEDFRFSDADVKRLASLLCRLPRAKPSWSRVPRAYIVLKLIGKETLLDQFLEEGFSDYLFPVDTNRLPDCLDAAERVAFVQRQHLVYTKAVDLEKGGHQTFSADQSDDLFTVNRVLGSSTSSQVDHVTSNFSYEDYARKRIVRRTTGQKRFGETASIFTGELTVLKRLKHEHVVSICGSYTDPKYFVLLLSPIAECNLAEYFSQVLKHPDLKVTLRTFLGCLATAVAYLHDNLVKHKDIKPQNILVHRGTVLLTDFGIARLAEDASGVTTDGWTLKTPRYCAPEVAAYDKRNNSSDVWSLGCVFLEIVTTLKGTAVADMLSFFHAHGSRETSVSANQEATEKWITQLEDLAPKGDNRALGWATTMLHQSRDARPTARQIARLAYEYHEGSPYVYGGLCCNSDIDTSDFSPSASVEDVTTREDTLASSVVQSGVSPHASDTFINNVRFLEPERLRQGSLPPASTSLQLVPVQNDLGALNPYPTRRNVDGGMPFEQQVVSVQSVPLPDQLPFSDQSLASLHSAANAATMRIYRSAMRVHGRQFASKIVAYVHDGGNYRADALAKAIINNEMDVLEWLLQAGLDANASSWQSMTPARPLELAMRKYVAEDTDTGAAVAILLDHGAQLASITPSAKFQFFERVCGSKHYPLIEKMLNSGYSLRDVENSHDFLSAACASLYYSPADMQLIVELLLRHGVRHWPTSREKESAMHRTLQNLLGGRKMWKYLSNNQARSVVLIALLRGGVLPRSQEHRRQVLRCALLFNKLEIIEILTEGGAPMTTEEAYFAMQVWYFDYDEHWEDSSLFWHAEFWKRGIHPFKRMELVPELFDDDKISAHHPIFFPITWYLMKLGAATDKPEHVQWERLIKEQFAQFASASKNSTEADIECWPVVDILTLVYWDAEREFYAESDSEDFQRHFRYILEHSKNLKVPLAVKRSHFYTPFHESELVAAICFTSDFAIIELLDSGVDVNEAVLDRSTGIYRSPLNFAMDPPKVDISLMATTDDQFDPEWSDTRRQAIVGLLKEKGARDFTKEPSAFKRLSRSSKWKKVLTGRR